MVAQRLDPTGGERQSAGGAAVLPVEDVRDHRVGVVDGEAADQVDGVLVGAQPVGWFAFDRHRQFGDRAALPAQQQLGVCFGVVAVHVDVDFVEQAAQQVFAVLVGGGRRRPHGGEVVAEREDHRFLLRGQGFRSCGFAAGEFGLGVGEGLQRGVPFGLQAAGDQAVVGVDGAVAALGAAGLDSGPARPGGATAPARRRGRPRAAGRRPGRPAAPRVAAPPGTPRRPRCRSPARRHAGGGRLCRRPACRCRCSSSRGWFWPGRRSRRRVCARRPRRWPAPAAARSPRGPRRCRAGARSGGCWPRIRVWLAW